MKKRSFVLGAVIGGIVGSVATALTTPKRGEELRGEIKEEAEKLYQEAKKKYGDISNEALNKYKKEVGELNDKYLSEDFKESVKSKFDEIKEKSKDFSTKTLESYKTELNKINEKYFAKRDEIAKHEEELNKEAKDSVSQEVETGTEQSIREHISGQEENKDINNTAQENKNIFKRSIIGKREDRVVKEEDVTKK